MPSIAIKFDLPERIPRDDVEASLLYFEKVVMVVDLVNILATYSHALSDPELGKPTIACSPELYQRLRMTRWSTSDRSVADVLRERSPDVAGIVGEYGPPERELQRLYDERVSLNDVNSMLWAEVRKRRDNEADLRRGVRASPADARRSCRDGARAHDRRDGGLRAACDRRSRGDPHGDAPRSTRRRVRMNDQREVSERAPVGGFGFTVRWQIRSHSVQFAAYEIVTDHVEEWATGARVVDTRPQYTREGSTDPCDFTTDPAEAEVYAAGSIKWDGCSTVSFGDGLHMCGRSCWQTHVDLVAFIWRRAGEILGPVLVDGVEMFEPLKLAPQQEAP